MHNWTGKSSSWTKPQEYQKTCKFIELKFELQKEKCKQTWVASSGLPSISKWMARIINSSMLKVQINIILPDFIEAVFIRNFTERLASLNRLISKLIESN